MTFPVLDQNRIETARLVMRPPVPADWQAFHDFMMSDRATAFGGHNNLGKAFRSFASELGHWQIKGFGMWAVTLKDDATDTARGLIGPWHPPDWPEAEIGWMMFDASLEGKGIASEAASAAVAHAYAVLGWPTVVSYVGIGNTRSARLAEKLGATLDASAAQPYPQDPLWVYRHPRPADRGTAAA